ncbi:hypothetical protein N0V90_000829 [Kalmusia sp. IMI 367209]|nr:hypothetical protein N0V90_000829 [Kalmusia sp. IMI 367209]
MTMDESASAAIERLSATPWCRALLESPEWTPTRTASRSPKPSGEDSFFAETLRSSRTIRSCTTLQPTEESKKGVEGVYHDSVHVIFEIGDGLNGHPNIAHGGFVATMLDESMGVLLTINMETKMKKRMRPHEGMNCFTAYLNISYKKPLPAPGIVLCTAKIVRRERNKIHMRATVEDGEGTVFTVGEGMFVEVNTKL